MRDPARVHVDCGRRQFLHTVLAGAAVGIAAHAGSEVASPPTLTPNPADSRCRSARITRGQSTVRRPAADLDCA